MKFSEVFEKSGINHDTKARRVLNTSDACANITAAEIENGVSLERLDQIGVPVYRYATQLTIHGKLPDFDVDARPAGFKSVFRNSNGTVGVRYVAIDAKKKELLVEANRYGHRLWTTRISSMGLDLYRSFTEKSACIEAFKSLPHDLFYGSISAGASPYGGYFIFAQIGAIPADNMWKVIHNITGVLSQADLDARLDEEKSRLEASRIAWETKRLADAELYQSKMAEMLSSIALPPLRKLEKLPADFIRVQTSFGVPRMLRYTFTNKKHLVYYSYADITNGKSPVFSKPIFFSKVIRARIEQDVCKGLVFKAEPLLATAESTR